MIPKNEGLCCLKEFNCNFRLFYTLITFYICIVQSMNKLLFLTLLLDGILSKWNKLDFVLNINCKPINITQTPSALTILSKPLWKMNYSNFIQVLKIIFIVSEQQIE